MLPSYDVAATGYSAQTTAGIVRQRCAGSRCNLSGGCAILSLRVQTQLEKENSAERKAAARSPKSANTTLGQATASGFRVPFGACQTSQVCRYYLCTLATLFAPGGTCATSRLRLHIAVCDLEGGIDFRSIFLRG